MSIHAPACIDTTGLNNDQGYSRIGSSSPDASSPDATAPDAGTVQTDKFRDAAPAASGEASIQMIEGGVAPPDDASNVAAVDARLPDMTEAGVVANPDAGPWRPPDVSKVKGTGNTCLSTPLASGGKCGSYYCGIDHATLAPELNPSKPCGVDAAYVCKGELTGITTQCSKDVQGPHTTDVLLGITDAYRVDIFNCIKQTPSVAMAKVQDACINCFVDATICCVNDVVGCGLPCSAGTVAECDQAQKQIGCIDKAFSCGGLPNPF